MLCVKGVRLGTVPTVGQAMPDFVDEEFNFVSVFDALYDWWLLFYSTSRQDIIKRQSLIDIVNYSAFYKAMSQLTPKAIKDMEDMTLTAIRTALSIYRPLDETLLSILGKFEKPATESERMKAEVQIWNIASQYRKRRFIIINGNICRIGPQGVEVGDHIVVVLECRVSIIFRERKDEDGGCINLGDMYLQGYMEGKAVEDVEDGVRKFENFELH
ncbi:hypothetical protein EAE96_007360 [Botrytis aclada]|nr:hypothetical protein EAE96_007360 [Botrytis aclada]